VNGSPVFSQSISAPASSSGTFRVGNTTYGNNFQGTITRLGVLKGTAWSSTDVAKISGALPVDSSYHLNTNENITLLKLHSRWVTQTFREAVYAPETDEVFIVLLTFTSDEVDSNKELLLPDPLYFSLDAVNTISRSNTYLAMPFTLEPPEESQDTPPAAKLTIDNIDRQIVGLLRQVNKPLTVKFEVVLASNPDVVEAVWEGFQLKNVTYDAFTIQGDLTLESFLQEPYPSGTFCPAYFPGIF
jgi:hypothetical protein